MTINGDGGRHRTSEFKITNMNLGELRWLVKQCEGMSDAATVEVQAHKDRGPMDWDEAFIKVRGQMP